MLIAASGAVGLGGESARPGAALGLIVPVGHFAPTMELAFEREHATRYEFAPGVVWSAGAFELGTALKLASEAGIRSWGLVLAGTFEFQLGRGGEREEEHS
jgi:hypothetical protein